MVLNDDRIWKRFFSTQMSAFFESYYADRGVRFVKSATVKQLRGNGIVSSVALADGQSVPCQMVVAGIGVTPLTEVLATSGLEVQDGVMVNEYLRTRHADIYAAGDVASYQDVIFGKRRRVEHWDNAVSQGQYCARALMGDQTPFRHVPYFFSDVFDLSYEYWGDASGADELIHRGDLASKSFSVWWLQQQRVVAVFTMNRPDEEREAAPKWIEEKRVVSTAKLKDTSAPISNMLE
jgi:NADPH-dependent 2,4-dienoyl-CoA reductase/sulfur reductase-like enzyme